MPGRAGLSSKKNGRAALRKQRYRCKAYLRQFITDYTYQGCRPEVRDSIVPMTMNGSGIRDICRVLKVSINTVLKLIRRRAEEVADLVPPPASRS